ncbi:MAG: phytanoyl-CoA dioxygenase family protein [Proteobacteria bacterium]|nr:phytanoyl-CoA dioxygenase family protein [Pseudomonadota bacterium]
MSITAADVEAFHRDGILTVESGIAPDVLDGILADLDALPAATRDEYLAGRIQDAWRHSRHIYAAATHQPILAMLEKLYGATPRPFQTLNFPRGTEQRAHADSIHFNSEPFGMMCGVWLALEDIGPDQGPLVYYPGSQHLAEINFEDIGVVPSYASYPHYERYIETTISQHRFEPLHATIRKGQIVIWAANVLHGGSLRRNKSLTRKSQVTHYYFAGCRYWRPGQSKRIRAYFEPDWIPHPSSAKRNPLKHFTWRVRNLVNRF